MTRVVIRGGWVLSMDPATGDLPVGDVLFDGPLIAAVGPSLQAADADVVDASGCVVMPGLVDTHRHCWHTAMRHSGRSAPVLPASPGVSEAVGAVDPEALHAATLLGLLGALDAGVTTVVDWADIQRSPEHTDAAIRAHREAGVRGVLAHGAPVGGDARGHAAALRGASAVLDSDPWSMTRLAMAARGPERASVDEAVEEWALARELGLRLTVHVGVGEGGRRGRLAELGRRGVLGPDTTYVHCSSLGDAELDLIASTGGSVSIATTAEATLGFGTPPVQRLMDRGIRPSLGVGTETNVGPDLFTQLRSLVSIQHLFAHEARRLTGDEVTPLPAVDAVGFATVEGARAVGLSGVTGTIAPGRAADVVVLRADGPDIAPLHDPYQAVVSAMDRGNVDSVFVAGRAVKRGGELVGFDRGRIRDLAAIAGGSPVAGEHGERG